MGGIRIGGAAQSLKSLPYVVIETQGSADNNLNVFRIVNDVAFRLTPWTDSTCTDPVCSGGLANPRLSPNGAWVVFTEVAGDDPGSFLYVVSTAGATEMADLIEVHFDVTEDELDYPSWHPDSDQILFIHGPGATGGGEKEGSIKLAQRTNPGGTPTELWVPAAITPQWEGAYRPKFSPDGTKIAFFVNLGSTVGGGDPTRQGLWVMDADGSNDQLISAFYPGSGTSTNRGYMFAGDQLDWSHDSEWIAFIKDGFAPGEGAVWKIRPDGSDEEKLTEGRTEDPTGSWRMGHGAWAPNDEFILYTYNPNEGAGTGDWRIHRVDPDGTNDQQLVSATNGPAGTQDYSCCFRNPFTNRIEWIRQTNPGRVASSDITGGDLFLNWHDISTDVGTNFTGTSGHENQ